MENILENFSFKNCKVKNSDEEKRHQFINDVSSTIETLINDEFTRLLLDAQKHFLKLDSDINKRIAKDIESIEIHELDEYKNELLDLLKNELIQTRKSALEQITSLEVEIE